MMPTDMQWWREFAETVAGRLAEASNQLAVETDTGQTLGADVTWRGEVDPEGQALGVFVITHLQARVESSKDPAAAGETFRVNLEVTPEPPYSTQATLSGRPPMAPRPGREEPRWDSVRPKFAEAVRQHVEKIANDVVAETPPPSGRRAPTR